MCHLRKGIKCGCFACRIALTAPAMVPAPPDASSFIADDTDGPAVEAADSAASSSFSSSYAAQRAIRRAGAADAGAWRAGNPGGVMVAPNLSGACGPELGRWVTPYRRRVGRWLTEVKQRASGFADLEHKWCLLSASTPTCASVHLIELVSS